MRHQPLEPLVLPPNHHLAQSFQELANFFRTAMIWWRSTTKALVLATEWSWKMSGHEFGNRERGPGRGAVGDRRRIDGPWLGQIKAFARRGENISSSGEMELDFTLSVIMLEPSRSTLPGAFS
jgi:hypothetical protein